MGFGFLETRGSHLVVRQGDFGRGCTHRRSCEFVRVQKKVWAGEERRRVLIPQLPYEGGRVSMEAHGADMH